MSETPITAPESEPLEPEGDEPRFSRRTWLIWSGMIAGVAVLLVAFASRFGNDPSIIASPLLNEPVAAVEVDLLGGEGSIRLDQIDAEVVVVNFWASWCIPCRTEHGFLLEANAAYRDRGVRFVGIVHQDSERSANAFLDDLGRGDGYTYAVDPGSRAAIEFGVFGIPETFFINRDGIITGKIAGPVAPSELAGTIERMLADGA